MAGNEGNYALSDFKKTAVFILTIGFLDTVAVATVIIQIFPRVLELGASPVQSGFIVSLYGAVQLFLSPIVGGFADGGNKKNFLIFSILSSAASYALLASPSLLTFCISRLLSGVVKHTQLLLMGILADIVPKDEKGSYMGYFGAGIGMGFIFGPVIGGHLAERESGFSLMCGFATTVFLANAVLVWAFLPSTTSTNKKDDSKSKKTKSKLKGLAGKLEDLGIDGCWDVLLLQCLVELAFMTHFTNFGIIFSKDYGQPPTSIGYTFAVFGIIGTVAAVFAGKLENFAGDRTLTIVFLWVLASYFALSVPAISMTTYLVALGFSSIAGSLLRSWWPNMAMSKCEPDKASSAVGAMHSVMAVAGMLGPLLAGFSTEAFGSHHGATYVAGLLLATVCVLSRWLPTKVVPKKKVS